MAQTSKSERLLNLLIMLLVQRHYVAKERIRTTLYADSTREAFEKMFERDKEELRSLGVPVEVGQMDALFDDEPGYRVRPERFALPEVELDPEEAAVVGLATRVWENTRLAQATADAVRKLTAAGMPTDASALALGEPSLSAPEPAFDVFWEATQDRVPLVFDYLRSGEAEPATRHLQPWGVARHRGRWYAVGFDTDRGEERVFRLGRVQGEARPDGPPGSFDVPPDVDVRGLARRLEPEPPQGEAVVLVREGAGLALRRTAASVETDVEGADTESRWDRLVVPAQQGLVDEVMMLGAAVEAIEPAWLRQEVVRRLRAAAAVESAAEPAVESAGASS